MKTAMATGAAGLIGPESVKRFDREGFILAEIQRACRAA